ncbi:hypothetical protein CPB83DRAFT_900731 [Crepidotus variabilis]|uniref:JmjC domain-containing protein n=1 Tax=Crepidotus variabilis TaxID=179855 RepID=A0A9P6E124_9AGAR|nr:hypothetical protein CPB83DRAFT_900731 [Crepidotus variabilis]
MDLEWTSKEYDGKVRLLLFFPPSYIFVGAPDCGVNGALQLWDVEDKSQKHELLLKPVILDGCISNGESPELWILLDTGHVHGFRVEDTNIVQIRKIRAHDSRGPVSVRGAIAVFDAQIASTLGRSVDIRGTDITDRRVIKINMADIFEENRLQKELTAVVFASHKRLLILSYEAGLLISYDLQYEMRSSVVNLSFHPSRVAFSRTEAMLALHDPFEGTFLYDLVTLKPWEEAKIPLAFPQAKVLPAYLTYAAGGDLLVIADGNQSLRLYSLKHGHRPEYQLLPIECARFYGIVAYQLQNEQDTQRVVSISRPVSSSRKWQINIWATHDIKAFIKNGSGELGELLQEEQCSSYNEHTLCVACWEARELCHRQPSSDICRFLRFRLLYQSTSDRTTRFPEAAKASRAPGAVLDKKDPRKILTAPFLLPLLANLLGRLEMYPCYIRELEVQKSVLCDICAGSILFDAWFCHQCGYEICGACRTNLPTSDEVHYAGILANSHDKAWFFPLHFQTTKAIQAVHSWLSKIVEEENSLLKARHCRSTSITRLHSAYAMEDFNDNSFMKLYHESVPFLISNFVAPSPLQSLFSELDCKVLFDSEFFDGSTWKLSSKIPLQLFFNHWEELHTWPRRLKLTDRLLQDSSDIRNKLLTRLQCLCPSLFSKNPQMGLLTYFLEQGSHRHLEDISISIVEKDNISGDARQLTFHPYGLAIVLLHSTANGQDQSVGAVYNIWPGSSLSSLSAAVDAHATEDDYAHGFPILAKKCSFDDHNVDSARPLDGLSSWRYEQQPGQAIFIPPGSPYQVTHQSNCIFASVPIVSIHDIPDAVKVVQAQRYRNLKADGSKIADTLGLELLVWNIWQ